MPTQYGPRKTSRASWTQEELNRAIHLVKVKKMPIRRAARENNVPESTLRDRLATGNFKKRSLGQPSYLGEDTERKLVEHIRKLQAAGFAPTRNIAREDILKKHFEKNCIQFGKIYGIEGEI